MKNKYITKKVFINKNNKQLSVSIPKKEFKKINPKLNFDEELFVKLQILRGKNGRSS